MNFKKFKRCLSLILSLCMILSFNMTSYAATGGTESTGDGDGTQVDQETCEHEWKLVRVIIAPDCETQEAGAGSYECTICHKTKLDDILPEHSYKEEITTPATCMAAGEKTLTCEYCGDTKTETIPIDPDAHDYTGDPEVVEATCTTEGSKTYTCKNGCGEKKVETLPVNADAHGYPEEPSRVIQAATCVESGSAVYVCEYDASHEDTRVIPIDTVNGHDYDGVTPVTTPATCVATGSSVYECKNGCGIPKTEELPIDEDAHKYPSDPTRTTNPTCIATGSKIYVCENGCGVDKVEEIPEDTTNGHNWVENEVITQPTCQTAGQIKYVCTLCQSEKTENVAADPKYHQWDEGRETTAPTCSAEGEKTFTCTVSGCNGGTGGAAATKTEPIDKLQHTAEQVDAIEPTCSTPGRTTGYLCKNCGQPVDGYDAPSVLPADESKHVYSKTPSAVMRKANCKTETNGLGRFTCTECGTASTYGIIPWEHSYPELGQGSNCTATCVADGTETAVCSGCGGEITRDVPALGHNYSTTPAANSIAATCAKDGVNYYECQRCTAGTKGHIKEEVVPSTGVEHRWGTSPEVDAAPDCVHGTRNGYICEICGAVDTSRGGTEADDALGHDYERDNSTNEGVVTKEPTCQETGVRTYTCGICGENTVGHTKTESISKVDHTTGNLDSSTGEDIGIDVPATCTESHKTKFICKWCKTEFDDEVDWSEIDPDNEGPLGHDYVLKDTIKAASCASEENGVGRFECSRCHDIKYNVIEAEHTWPADGTVTKEPTCTQPGEKTFTCTVCQTGTKTEPITKLGHSYGTAVVADHPANKAATCTENGIEVHECTRCTSTEEGHYELKPTDKIAHTIVEYTESDPQHAECDHYVRWGKVCSVCRQLITEGEDPSTYGVIDDPSEAGYEPMTAHVDAEEFIEPTCTEAGKILHYCKTCKQPMLDADGNAIPDEDLSDILPALGHKFDTLVSTVRPATCTTPGAATYECSVCRAATSYVILPASHTYGENPVSSTAATCTSDGSKVYECTVCEEGTAGHTKTEVIPATGHDYEAEVTTPATCKPGVRTYTCKNCGDSYTQSIPAVLEHTWDVGGYSVPATCVDAAMEGDICTVCNTTRNVVSVGEPNGHTYNAGVVTTEATCTQTGVKTYTCTVAGCTEEDEGHSYTEEIPMTPHQLVDVYVPATCTENGKASVKCTVCQQQIGDVTDLGALDPKLDHANKYTVEATPATCMEVAKTAGVYCPDCETWIVEREDAGTELDPNNHVWDEGVVTKAPTCQEKGVRTYTCINENHTTPVTKAEDIEKAEHEWGEPYANESETGILHQCKNCEEIELAFVKKGYVYCPVCKDVVKSVITEGTPATCTEPGSTDKVSCENGHVVTESEVIPKKGHDYEAEDYVPSDDAIVEAASKPPTCSEDGYLVYACQNCNADTPGHTTRVEKKATGVHTYKETLVEATCTENAKITSVCTQCGNAEPGAKVEEIPNSALGHNYVNGVCTRDSSHVCQHSKYIDKTVEATCTENAKAGKVCAECGLEDPENPVEEVPDSALGHEFKNGRCVRCNIVEVQVTTAMSWEDAAPKKYVKITANSVRNNPNMELLEVGFLYINSDEYTGTAANDLFYEYAGNKNVANGLVKKASSTTIEANTTGYSAKINAANYQARTIHTRAFIRVKDKETEEVTVIYGPVMAKSYADLNPAQ